MNMVRTWASSNIDTWLSMTANGPEKVVERMEEATINNWAIIIVGDEDGGRDEGEGLAARSG